MAEPTRVIGTPGAIQQGKKYSGGPNKPDTTTLTFKGPKAHVLALIPTFRTEGYEWDIVEDGPNATATAVSTVLPGSDEASQVLVDSWEMTPGEVEKDLLEADVAVINSLNEKTRQQIRDLIAKHETSGVTAATFTNETTLQATAFQVYSYMAKGMRSIRVFAPVLKRTLTVSNKYQTLVSLTNVGRILNSAHMLQNESVPSNYIIALASAPFTATAADNANYKYGWYKKSPTLAVAAGTRMQITQEYEFGLWPVLFYGAILT